MKLIINADDFGLCHDVNMAIVEAFQKGYITNTTIMVNMPGFEEAVELSKQYGFFDKVGLHFNVFTGNPLTENIKHVPLFYRDGGLDSFMFFHESTWKDKMFSNSIIAEALFKEAEAQIGYYIKAGFPEMHFDSHGHSHTFPIIWNAIKPAIKTNGFRTIRKTLNFPINSLPKQLYKSYFNNLLLGSYKTTSLFMDGSGFFEWSKQRKEVGSVEVMVHPVYDENKEVRNLGNHPNLPDILRFAESGFEMVSYMQL